MRPTRILVLLVVLTATGRGHDVAAGPYTMDRVTFGGGQFTSVAGSYSLTGGAGAPLGQSSSGGLYVLQSGFWALPGSGTSDVPVITPPATTALLRSAPNPFSSRTEIAFTLAEARPVRVEIFDLRGARVRTLLPDRTMDAGLYRLPWDGRGEDGGALPAGIYWVQFQSGAVRERSRVVRLP